MLFSKRTARKAIKTWPQRLAISVALAFLVWNFSGENLFVFVSVMLISQLILTMMNNRIPEERTSFNEEMRY